MPPQLMAWVSVRNIVVDGVCGKDRLVCGSIVGVVESALDSILACAKPGAENGFHSKSLVGSGRMGCGYIH